MSPPILHRDIKPENILFHEGKIKMADFGWSNLEDDFRNTYCGTPDYLSPEMIRGTGHNEKLDIWTVGILMFELLHGIPPFRPKKKIKDKRVFQRKIEYNVLNGNIEFDPKLSKEVVEIIRVLIASKPEKRPTAGKAFDFVFFKQYGISLVDDVKSSKDLKNPKSRSKSKSGMKRKYEEKIVKIKLQRDNYKCRFELGEKLLEKEKEKKENLFKEYKEMEDRNKLFQKKITKLKEENLKLKKSPAILFKQFNKLQDEESKDTIINSNKALNNLINGFYFDKIEQRNENRRNFFQNKDPIQKLKEIFLIFQNNKQFNRPSSIENKKNIQNVIINPLMSCRKIINSAHSQKFVKKNNKRNNVVVSNFFIPPNGQDNTSTLKTFHRMKTVNNLQ